MDNDKYQVLYLLGKGHYRYHISYNSLEELDRKLEEAIAKKTSHRIRKEK